MIFWYIMPTVKTYNIIKKHLGNTGLHWYGSSRLAINHIATMRKLWKGVGYPSCSSDVKSTESTNKDVSKTFETTGGNCKDGPFHVLKKVRANNRVNRVLIGHLDINSIRNKFYTLSSMIKNNIDLIFLFHNRSLSLKVMLLHSDMTEIIMVVAFCFLEVNIYLPSKLTQVKKDFKEIFVELNLRKKINLFCCSYNPRKINISSSLYSPVNLR